MLCMTISTNWRTGADSFRYKADDGLKRTGRTSAMRALRAVCGPLAGTPARPAHIRPALRLMRAVFRRVKVCYNLVSYWHIDKDEGVFTHDYAYRIF